jgi:uncharacterized membrane protein
MNLEIKGFLKKILMSLSVFLSSKRNRRFVYLAAISLFALGEFLFSGLVRRTFVFYSFIEGNTIVEDRMLHRSSRAETDIRRYVDELLLGPVSPDSAPLFPRETRLSSFMYREGVVYADLTESAALPSGGNGDVFRSLVTMIEGLRRNFPNIRDVRLFIGGNEVFFKEFHGIFSNPADNSKTSP